MQPAQLPEHVQNLLRLSHLRQIQQPERRTLSLQAWIWSPPHTNKLAASKIHSHLYTYREHSVEAIEGIFFDHIAQQHRSDKTHALCSSVTINHQSCKSTRVGTLTLQIRSSLYLTVPDFGVQGRVPHQHSAQRSLSWPAVLVEHLVRGERAVNVAPNLR